MSDALSFQRVARLNALLGANGFRPLNPAQAQRMFEQYENHCWNCERRVSSEGSIPCPECNWWICECGVCRSPQYGGCTRA
jgi:hypothetical protein